MKANKIFKIGSREIEVNVVLEEVIDFNKLNRFVEGDPEFNSDWFGANVSFEIGEGSGYGQVQYDGLNHCYSASCDGNVLGDEIREALLANFSNEDLYVEDGDSELHYDLMDKTFPEIDDFICEFGGQAIEAEKE